MVALGITLTVSTLLGIVATWLLNLFIRHTGGLADVGLYQSATAITTGYIGFVFSAMAMDYFPRLAAVSEDPEAVCGSVNRQGEMVMLVAAPIVVALLATTPLVVRLLLSAEFTAVIPVVRWMGLALIFKTASFAMGYISFAKGDRRTFLWLEGVLSNLLNVGFALCGYLLWGLTGLGVGTLATYMIYFAVVSVVAYRRYDFRFEREFVRLMALLGGLCTVAFVLTLAVGDALWCGLATGAVLVVTCAVCWRELNERMDIGGMIRNRIRRR
jgi:O-antigen/teichoic acid export membrane protein